MALTAARLIAYIGGDASGATQAMGQADAGLKSLARQFAAFTGVTIGAAAVGRLTKDVLEAGIAFNSLQEQSTIAFTTMLGSGQEATRFLEELQEFAVFTPFEYAGLVEQAQRLKAFGFAAKDVVPMLTAVGDAVSGLGGGEEKINRVTLALGQMQAKGKVSSQEMMQLTEAGIPAWQYLADVLGTDVAGAMKLVEQRAVDSDQAINGILAGMRTDFGGMMAQQAQTMEGAWSTITDTAKQIAGELTEPIFEALRDSMVAFATETLPQWKADIETTVRDMRAFLGMYESDPGKRSTEEAQVAALSTWREQEREVAKLEASIAALEKRREDFGGLLPDEQALLDAYVRRLQDIQREAQIASVWVQELGAIAAGYESRREGLIGLDWDPFPWVKDISPSEDTERIKWFGQVDEQGEVLEEGIIAAHRRSDRDVRILQYEQAQEYERDLQSAIEDAHREARSRVEGILFTPSSVTQEDMFRTQNPSVFGGYEDKPDEYVRRLEAAAQDADSEWRKLLIPEDVIAAGEDAIRIYVDRQKEAFYSGMLPDEVNWDAFAAEYQQQAQEAAAKEALVDRGVVELQARGIEVSAADVQAMVEPGAGAAKTLTEEFAKGLKTQSPMTMLLDQINAEMAERKESIREAGTAFFEMFISGISDVSETVIEGLISVLLPGLISEMEYQGYLGGEKP